VEELVWQIRRLPPGEGVGGVAGAALPNLDSRACAALLKELARSGLAQRAQEFFDFVLALGPGHEAGGRLADVYTYTAAISNCVGSQQVHPGLPGFCCCLSQQLHHTWMHSNSTCGVRAALDIAYQASHVRPE
jgi:hypothetical protein